MKDIKTYIALGFMTLFGVLFVLFYWLKLIDWAYTDDNDKIIMVAAISLIGALVGGAISGGLTLLGVSISIRDNAKLRMKNDLPGKISHIESALRKLNQAIESEIAFNPKYGTARFISINTSYELEFLDFIKELTEVLPEDLKEDFIYIDADAYRMYLRSRENVELLEMELENETRMLIEDFNWSFTDNLARVYVKKKLVEINDLKISETLEGHEHIVNFVGLYNTLMQKDREFSFKIELIYKDLHTQLQMKHERLIKELDY